MSIIDYMPGGLSPESLALILTGLSAGLIVFAVWQTLLHATAQSFILTLRSFLGGVRMMEHTS